MGNRHFKQVEPVTSLERFADPESTSHLLRMYSPQPSSNNYELPALGRRARIDTSSLARGVGRTYQEAVEMNALISTILMTSMVLLGSVAVADAQKLSGKDNGKPPAFTVDGPWTMDWSARSDYPLSASIEMRLHDGTTGEFIGMVAEIKGTGRGLKLFENAGTFQVVVVGAFVEWDIEIQEISEEQAASLKRGAEGGPSLLDSAKRASRRVPEGSFASWRPQDDENLLLFDDYGIRWRVSFSPACPGLKSATAISFVTPADGGLDEYDSIMLDDGTRCYFDRVIPTAAR